ncbi:hypothetical protein COBT_002244 [Conglomerata obtusa]
MNIVFFAFFIFVVEILVCNPDGKILYDYDKMLMHLENITVQNKCKNLDSLYTNSEFLLIHFLQKNDQFVQAIADLLSDLFKHYESENGPNFYMYSQYNNPYMPSFNGSKYMLNFFQNAYNYRSCRAIIILIYICIIIYPSKEWFTVAKQQHVTIEVIKTLMI